MDRLRSFVLLVFLLPQLLAHPGRTSAPATDTDTSPPTTADLAVFPEICEPLCLSVAVLLVMHQHMARDSWSKVFEMFSLWQELVINMVMLLTGVVTVLTPTRAGVRVIYGTSSL